MGSVIKVNGLIKQFGDNEAVAGIDFSVEQGEVFGLLGPNGAGKTTTIRVLTTLLPPTAGSVQIDGFDVVKHASAVRQRIGYVPQALSAVGMLTGFENLLITAKLLRLPKAEREQRIEEVLDLLNLREAASKLVSQYSGGMVRRLEIGLAILHRPKVLILDEPTVGLDPIARRTIWEVFDQLRSETEMTVLITTHYMEEAEVICQRLAIMSKGRIVAHGTPEELKARLDNPDATIEDVFAHFAGGQFVESGGSYRDTRRLRKRMQRYN